MQRWLTERFWLLLSFLSPICARPQYIAPLQSIQTGPYKIYNCDDHTIALYTLFNTLFATLEPVLDDLSPHTSSNAYTTFFKTIALAPTVYDILSNIKTGKPISPGPHAIKNAPPDYFGPPVTPQFVCVTDYKQVTWSLEAGGRGGRQSDAYTTCQQSPVNAFGVFGSKYLNNTIVLCPAFWKFAAIPPSSKATCLTINPHFNRFRDTGKRLVNYQLWVILHQLAHVYIYARSGTLSELSTANDCVSLAAGSAVNNAQNYVFYAANIRLGCTDFPLNRRPEYSGTVPTHANSVELLEIDTNTTLVGGSKATNASIYEGQSIGNSSSTTGMDLPNLVDPAPWPT